MPPDILVNCLKLGKSYTHQPLFQDITLGFHAGERLGLIGPNGSGKSTLLKMLAGLETPDSGEVVRKRGVRVVYLPQTDRFDEGLNVGQVLRQALPENPDSVPQDHRVREAAARVGLASLDQAAGELSGGWRKRLAIARALIQEPDLLLLDEPTNHLDLESILWLEGLLKDTAQAFVLVSHDRAFLEAVTNRMVELNRLYPDGYLRVEGNYSAFLERRQAFAAAQGREQSALANRVRREVEWLRRGPKARTTKAKSRIDEAHRLQGELAEVQARNVVDRRVRIEFDATGRRTKKLLQARGLGLERGGRTLFSDLDLILSPGTRLGIMGRNGSGKSSLLHLLAGDLQPTQGSVHRAEGVKTVVFDQRREQLDPNQSLQEALCPSGDLVVFQGRPLHVMAWARRFLFSPQQLPLPVSRLSGGEQSRLLIARLMLQTADVLLLDEPTNDIDIPTLEMLEESLEAFPGAVVLITHDRLLLDSLSDRLLFLDGQGRTEFFADTDQWLASREPARLPEPPRKKEVRPRPDKPKKLPYREQSELNRMEQTIEQAEAAAAGLRERMLDPAVASDAGRLTELHGQLEQAELEVARLYERWEELEALRQSL